MERAGFIIDPETGSRYMQTFRKLPMHRPNKKINISIEWIDIYFCIINVSVDSV
jgi:hypothetical protein